MTSSTSSSPPGAHLFPSEEKLAHAAMRERYRDWYLAHRDPIPQQRLKWRAQLFRQLVHLLPGEKILELGAGKGDFTAQLVAVSRGENEVTGASFESSPGDLHGEFDHVVGYDILDARDAHRVLGMAYSQLAPGGQAVFFATNPGNPVLRMRRAASRISRNPDERGLLSRQRLAEGLVKAGFENVVTMFTDFLYAPLSPRGTTHLHDLSAIMQNTPGVQRMSGAIVAHAQKPGTRRVRSANLARHGKLHHSVSVVIPCHNEEMNVAPLVERLLALYGDYIHEIILVDDNSVDDTASQIRSLESSEVRVRGIFRSPPAGAGRALADGYRAATGKYILSLDADFVHLLPEMRDMFDAIASGYDVAVGSRFSPDSVLLNYPVQKIIANRGFHFLASKFLRRPFRDLTNNLKLMRRDVAARLELDQPGFAFNAETGMAPLVLGYRVAEVPISWVGRDATMGASSFRLAAAGAGYLSVLRRLYSMRQKG